MKRNPNYKYCVCGCNKFYPNNEKYFYKRSDYSYRLMNISKKCYKENLKQKRKDTKEIRTKICSYYPDYIYC